MIAPKRRADLFRQETNAKIDQLNDEIIAMTSTASGQELTAKILERRGLEKQLTLEESVYANNN